MSGRPSRHSASSWITRADEDIAAVELCLTAANPLINIAAFHAQQAAEKLLKAAIASTGIEPPRVHDLAELADLAANAEPAIRAQAEQVETITSWAVLTRYPSHGDTPPPTCEEISAALQLVKELRGVVAETTAR